jgi:hypothetical protein
MRRTRAARALLSLCVLAMLAGCNGAGPEGDDADAGGGGTTAGPSGSDHAGEAPDPSEGFAVLVASGRLAGEGPEPEAVMACSIEAADGSLDLDARKAWARPGQHSFKVGQTWLLVVDEVEVDDPRRTDCGVRSVTPFTATGNWEPQVGDGVFSLDVSPDGDRLLVSRNAIGPGGSFEAYVEFEDGDHTFKGDVTFTHAGWWPPQAFEEREEDPDGDGAVWWA